MWMPSPEILENPALNRDTLLVCQAWRELLDHRSPDTYRARALDPFLLVDELIKVCELAKNDQKWLTHVHAICAEIGEEQVAFSRLGVPPSARHAFTVLGRFTNVKHDDLHRVRQAALLVKDVCGPPLALLFSDAHALIDGGIREKSDFLRTLGFIATHAYRLGAQEGVNAAIDRSNLLGSPGEILELISGQMNPGEKRFNCFLAVEGSLSDLDSFLAGSGIVRIGLPRIDRSEAGRAWHQANSNLYLLQIEVIATTGRIAAEDALARLQSMLNVLALYANSATHRIASSVLVEEGAEHTPVDVSPAKHYGLFPRKDHINTARGRISQLGSRLDGRLANALGAHALGVSAADPRAALSHFWTSLEAVVGGLGGGSIGEKVSTLIAPIVVARRIHKIATYLSLGINESKKAARLQTDVALMPSSTKGHVSREDVLSCLTGSEGNAGITDLFRICGANPLLCHHLLRAWQELNNPRELAKSLRRSEQRVKWQLLRIYRARNIFVHRGGGDEQVWRLLENAQSYISFVVGRLLVDMSKPYGWDIDSALEYERQQFDRVCIAMEQLGKNCGLLTSELIPHLSRQAIDIPLWGDGSRFGN